MSRRFPLATVLRVAELRERAARASVAAANGAVARARTQEEVRRGLLAAAALGTGEVGGFLDDARRRELRAAALRASEDATLDAEVVRDSAVTEWSAAAARVHALEELRQRHADAVAAGEQRAEQRLLDDLAGRRAP